MMGAVVVTDTVIIVDTVIGLGGVAGEPETGDASSWRPPNSTGPTKSSAGSCETSRSSKLKNAAILNQEQ